MRLGNRQRTPIILTGRQLTSLAGKRSFLRLLLVIPVYDAVHVNDFQATLLHLFGLDHLRLTHRFRGLDVRLTNQGGRVVKRLLA